MTDTSRQACPRLIEVALPIREISAESVRDKSLRLGHISTLHLWWARRPLAASRAVVFASLVPDPDDPACPAEFRAAVVRLLQEQVPSLLKGYWRGRRYHQDPDPYRPYDDIPDTPRNRLLTFIAKWSPEWLAFEQGETDTEPEPGEMLDDRSLVKWETSDPQNEQGHAILDVARELVRVAYGGQTPVLLDPFAGGGAIPLEAGRLGCQAIANDYNPVAYLILRATCEFPQRYGQPSKRTVERLEYGQIAYEETEVPNGLAHDIDYWATWIFERAHERVGYLYPPGEDGQPIVGYLWARTVPCPNPSCRKQIPLLRSLIVCDLRNQSKRVALKMTVDKLSGTAEFGILHGGEITQTRGTKEQRAPAICPFCLQATSEADLRQAGIEGKIGGRMVAVIIESPHGKDYRPVQQSDLAAFDNARRLVGEFDCLREYIVPEINAPNAPPDAGPHRSISVDLYGFKTFGSIFNERQLVTMHTLVSCLREALEAIEAQVVDPEYRRALSLYLGLLIDRYAQRMSTVGVWHTGQETFEHPFGRQSIPMTWDYPEANPFSLFSQKVMSSNYIVSVIERESPTQSNPPSPAIVHLGDGANLSAVVQEADVLVTDPPYFDSIAYGDLSDYFYVWLKRGLYDVYPEAFITPQTPKSEEAVAHKHRHHGNRARGEEHFQRRLVACFNDAKGICKSDGVIAIMFAHQSTKAWTALINAIFEVGLNIEATWPIDTEKTYALKTDKAVLGSSITVICRPRRAQAAASFRDVRSDIERVVADSVHRFWDYGFRGADLVVACYGPAVGVFGRYERVERADGTPVTVPDLLKLAKESALKAIAGEFTGDPLSRLYFVWANLYGTGEQAWDDARLVVQVGGEGEDAMEVARRRGLFVVDGATCRLAVLRDRASRRGLGDDPADPLVDQLHHAMLLWKQERRADLVRYLRDQGLAEHGPFWKLAQALFQVLPRGEEDWKLVSALLGERETLRVEARRAEPPIEPPVQPTLFEV